MPMALVLSFSKLVICDWVGGDSSLDGCEEGDQQYAKLALSLMTRDLVRVF